MPPQQATTGPAPMEGVERTNAVVVRGAEQEVGAPPRRDPYALKVDRGRNCYACGGFGHIACHCRNRGGRVAEGRSVIAQGCGQTLARVRVSWTYISIIIISLQQLESM